MNSSPVRKDHPVGHTKTESWVKRLSSLFSGQNPTAAPTSPKQKSERRVLPAKRQRSRHTRRERVFILIPESYTSSPYWGWEQARYR